MALLSELRAPVTQANIQDVFLNHARRERTVITIHLLDGREVQAHLKNFDRFAIVVEVDGADQLIFKHAISTIATGQSVANYYPTHRS